MGTDDVGSHINGKSQPLRRNKPDLDLGEIQAAIDPSAYPPILTVQQAAQLLQISHHTLYRAVSEGRYKAAVRRGKPLRFWRDRLVQLFFQS